MSKAPAKPIGPDPDPPFDRRMLLKTFDHDWAFLKETVGMLLEDYPPLMEEMQRAVERRDAVNLRRAAHSLKGMVGNFQATGAAKAALRLETMGRKNAFSGAEKAFDDLVGEMERFKDSLLRMIGEERH